MRNGYLNDVIGVVNLRNLLDDTRTVAEVTPHTRGVPRHRASLRRVAPVQGRARTVSAGRRGARRHRRHRHPGGPAEEIVGETYDETDRDIMAVRTEPDGAMQLPGTFPIHDRPDLAVEITDAPEGDYATIAGLVLAALGRIPDHPATASS